MLIDAEWCITMTDKAYEAGKALAAAPAPKTTIQKVGDFLTKWGPVIGTGGLVALLTYRKARSGKSSTPKKSLY